LTFGGPTARYMLVVASIAPGQGGSLMLGSNRPVFTRPNSANQFAKAAALSSEQLLVVRQFVARVGGLENARRAIEMLVLLNRPA
jgi:hypothetical protein